MKSRDNVMRLKRFQVEEKTRQLTQIDMMVAELERMRGDLEAQIRIEEEKSGISDPEHFAYPTFAKAVRQRKENLDVSIRELQEKRINAEAAVEEADEELKKAQKLGARDQVEEPVEDDEELIDQRMMIG